MGPNKLHPMLQHMLRQGVHPAVVQQMHQRAAAGAQQVFQQALQHRMMQKAARRASRGR